MMIRNKKKLFVLLLIGCALLAYVIRIYLRPVEIVAVHEDGNFSSVLVKTFPFTDKMKIDWWLKNKDMLKEKYGIPRPDSDGSFTVIFWDFGDGYKETDGYDRLCFKDMKPPKNCIDKNSFMFVKNGKNTGMTFWADNGIYRVKKSGEMVKTRYK
ncbi:DUF943 family protein [Kosakonia oryziphila]|jgi:Enterobacterial putative membrane protein (DUF943).|uniref:Putative membrane protein n=1 Tax=Kosakonia oryziphila TaxID=1005667 RepID=A0A1C4C1T3_9ENTR|nr:DUF943 family protein [Kosakonia oryziphila]SCC13071.1 putative membrane protein [Kosakonia oryziphila]